MPKQNPVSTKIKEIKEQYSEYFSYILYLIAQQTNKVINKFGLVYTVYFCFPTTKTLYLAYNLTKLEAKTLN